MNQKLTKVDLSQESAQRIYVSISTSLGVFGLFFIIVFLGPLLLATGLFVVTFLVAGVVFAIQALVVGAQTYLDPFDNYCQNYLGIWLIVYGSLSLGTIILPNCCTTRKEDGKRSPGNFFTFLLQLTTSAWLFYGVNIVYATPANSSVFCVPSQTEVFTMIVMFMFWGLIALLASFMLLICCIAPFAMMVADEAAAEAEQQQEQEEQRQEEARMQVV